MARRTKGRYRDYRPETSLPVCSTGTMEWELTLKVNTGTEQVLIPIRFTTPDGGLGIMIPTRGLLVIIALILDMNIGLTKFWHPLPDRSACTICAAMLYFGEPSARTSALRKEIKVPVRNPMTAGMPMGHDMPMRKY